MRHGHVTCVTVGLLALCVLFAPCTAGAAVEGEVDQIVKSLRQASVDEVWSAQRKLVGLGQGAVAVLKQRLPKARPAAQLAMAKALCKLDAAEDAVDTLAGLIRKGQKPEYSIAAASVLGDKPAYYVPATERHLIRLAKDTSLSPAVSRAVARALGAAAMSEEGIKQAVQALRRLLTTAETDLDRWDSAMALAEIDDFAPPVGTILEEIEDMPTLRGRTARLLLENRRLVDDLIGPKNREGRLNDRLLEEIKAAIQKYHVEEPPADHELVNAAARGMVRILLRSDHPDRHSAYFDEEDWKKFREHISGHYGGIGAVVQFIKHFDTGDQPVFTVARPNYHGPAYKAGLRAYDRIVEVEGSPTALPEDMSPAKHLKSVVDKLRGTPGTKVNIAYTRPGSTEKHAVQITRARIDVPSVSHRLLPAGVGYLRLSAFSSSSAEDLDKALRDMEKRGMAALVLDLRNNPGGQLRAAVAIADNFLKDNKLIVYTKGRNQRMAPREEYRTKDPTTHPDYPIVVLINGHSASASEIVSGALQDHKRATLLGETTYGKGSVQKLFPMAATAGQSGLKLTIAKYYLPSGRSIHGKGVEPDIEVANEPTFTREEFERLRVSGAFHRYASQHFEQQKPLLSKLADFDGLDASRYPGFQEWFEGLAEESGRDKARRLLRAWLRILVADARGAEFICDLEEDTQLQAAIREVARRIDEIDLKAVPEYGHFATKQTVAKPVREAEAESTDEDTD